MKSQEKRQMMRNEFVERLRQVADMVESGGVRVGEAAVDMPDDLQYEMELEEEQSEGKLEIEVEWQR